MRRTCINKRKEKIKEKHFIYHPRKERNSISLHIKNSSFFFVSVCDFLCYFTSCTPNCCVPITQDSWRVKRLATDQSDREENLLENFFVVFLFFFFFFEKKKKIQNTKINKQNQSLSKEAFNFLLGFCGIFFCVVVFLFWVAASRENIGESFFQWN